MPKVYGKTIIASKITEEKSVMRPGEILLEDESSILISSMDYNIILYKGAIEES